jgi:hypothetical protein
VFIARRADISEGKLPFGAVDERSAWQMPQGGVDEGEEIRAAGAGENPTRPVVPAWFGTLTRPTARLRCCSNAGASGGDGRQLRRAAA